MQTPQEVDPTWAISVRPSDIVQEDGGNYSVIFSVTTGPAGSGSSEPAWDSYSLTEITLGAQTVSSALKNPVPGRGPYDWPPQNRVEMQGVPGGPQTFTIKVMKDDKFATTTLSVNVQ